MPLAGLIPGKRVDPLRGFRFRVDIVGLPPLGFKGVDGIGEETRVETYKEGRGAGVIHNLPAETAPTGPLVLEKGVAQTVDSMMLWRRLVFDPLARGGEPSEGLSLGFGIGLLSFRKNVVVTVLTAQDVPERVFLLKRAWPSKVEFTKLDAQANDVWIERLTVPYEELEELGNVAARAVIGAIPTAARFVGRLL